MIKLYHGSNVRVTTPDLSKSKPYKDFGQGFYLSDNYEQAARLAELRASMLKRGVPTVSCFTFDERLLEDASLNIKLFENYTEEWAEFVIRNRDFNLHHPIHNYDIVYGPIADDGVTFQLRRYHAGAISLKELIDELKYAGGITFQYYFGTEQALLKLTPYEAY